MSDANTAEERAAASLTAACYATDADDLRLTLSILGLIGKNGSPPCRKCGEQIARIAADGYNQQAGDGMCRRCFIGEKRVAPIPMSAGSRCIRCARPTARYPKSGQTRYGGRGMCGACYAKWRRSQDKHDAAVAGVCRNCGGPTPDRRHTCTGCRVLIPSWPIREYVQTLIDSGKAVHRIAAEAELPHSSVRGVMGGWENLTTYIADQLLSVRPRQPAGLVAS